MGYKEGRWIFKAKESYFSSNSNYNRAGEEVSLPSNGYFQTFTSSFSLTHDVSKRLSLYTIFDAVYGKSRDAQFERTRFIPTEIKFGGDFLLTKIWFNVVPEAQLTIPITTVSDTTDEVILNEGAVETKLGLYLSKHTKWLSGYAYGGYIYRSDGRSSLFSYDFQLLKSLNTVQIAAGLWGYYSLTDDIYILETQRRDVVTSRVNGGSLRFYSVNPNITEIGGSIGFPLFDGIFSRLGLSTTMAGERTAAGSTIWATLSYTFGSTTKSPMYQEQKREDFVPETYPDEKFYHEQVKDIPAEAQKIEPEETLPPPRRSKKLQKPGTTEIMKKKRSGPPVEVKLRTIKRKKNNTQ